MPASRLVAFVPRLPSVSACLFGLGMGLASIAALASDAAPAADAGKVERAVKKPVVPEPAAARDPMEVLRKRLAAKLGASRAVEADSAHTVRIVAKSNAAVHSDDDSVAATPAAAPRAPRRKPAAADAAHAGTPAEHAAHWSHAGDAAGGPEAWGRLKPEFAKCATGTRQSPIDIREGLKVDLDPVRFDYKPSAFRIIDNCHTVQVNLAAGNSIEVGSRRFELLQFHFHRPSEERIDGRQFEMVAHLVHKDLEGRLAVVALLLERGPAHAVVQSVWNNLPLEKNEEQVARGLLDLASLLPAERRYFTYMGSLTTPPCSEGVLWMVLKAPVALSAEQIGIFARLYPMNARPIQSAAGRMIKESN